MKLFISIVIVFSSTCLFAQDIIVFRNGEEIEARVEEVAEKTIKYRKYDNLSGPLYTVNKSEVFMIRYENGDRDVFKETSSTDVRPLHDNAFIINPLGLLQFGPIFQWETKVSSNTYLVPHFRWGYLGVLTHVDWGMLEYDNAALSPLNFGFGLGTRAFNQNSPVKSHAFYYGGLLELSVGKANYGIGFPYETQEKYTGLAFVGNAGYRWRYPGSSFLNLGLFFGAEYALSDVERYVNGAQSVYRDSSGEIYPVFMLELSFGWEKKK